VGQISVAFPALAATATKATASVIKTFFIIENFLIVNTEYTFSFYQLPNT